MPAFSNISASPNTRRNLKNAQQKALHSATSAPGNDSDDAQHQEVPTTARPSRKAKQDTIERQRQAQALNDERRGKKTNARKRAGTESYVEAEATSAKYQKTS